MNKLKVMTIVGTRPEVIRLSATIKLIDEYMDHIFVHTGQNYDFELNEIFYKDLGLRKPNYFMNIDASSLGISISEIFKKTEEIIDKERPDALLVLGDTNSCLSAYLAKRKHIPVFHMEAGNRCFDYNVPEEINRRIIDHIADYNLVYTEHARRHLISEGIEHRRIYLTGSPMREVINQNMSRIESSKIMDKLKLKKNSFFTISIHREENVDNEKKLINILNILKLIKKTYKLPVIISMHPRTKKRIEMIDKLLLSDKNLKFFKPFSFTDYIKLQKNSFCTISDSGTISEESSILNFPAISLRDSMERPEAQDAGSIILTGFKDKIVLNSIDLVADEAKNRKIRSIPLEYEIEDTSWRVLKLIIGNTKLSNKWHGINK